MTTAEHTPDAIVRRGVARIGHGAKLHPAIEHASGWKNIICSCPGTQSGRAQNKASFYWGDRYARTCGPACTKA